MFETTEIPNKTVFEEIYCDLCGSDKNILWDIARSNKLSRCKNCGLVFTNPRIKNAKEKDQIIYSESYFQQKSRMTDEMLKARKKTYQFEIQSLMDFVKNGRILDVGCGMGVFLESFGKEWEKYGCDISSYALSIAQEKGVEVYQGEFEHLDLKKDFFDVVYFRASLHHTYSPKKCLKNAHKILKPNGLIAICMSNNCSGIAGRLFKGHVKSYEQGHNYLFSHSTLNRYLADCCFELLNVSYPYWGTGYESYRDFTDIVFLYAKYIFLRSFSKLNDPKYYDFSSPTFFGNYINIYAKKV